MPPQGQRRSGAIVFVRSRRDPRFLSERRQKSARVAGDPKSRKVPESTGRCSELMHPRCRQCFGSASLHPEEISWTTGLLTSTSCYIVTRINKCRQSPRHLAVAQFEK